MDVAESDANQKQTMKAFQSAVKNAIETYASLLGITIAEAAERYRTFESAREVISLLVLSQADPDKLREMAPTLA